MSDDNVTRFTGSESTGTEAFETRGPWLLYWSTHSKFPEMASFELRVYDVETGKFLGAVRDDDGANGGRRLFQDAGTFRIEVISKALTWNIEISDISRARSAELKRASEGSTTLKDAASTAARAVPADSFVSWRPEDDATLLLFSSDEATGFRITFGEPCTGLADARALSFLSVPGAGPEKFDSILLDDGTRCYFDRVVPTVFD